MSNPTLEHSVEITKEAALLVIGDRAKAYTDFGRNDLAEWTRYHGEGCNLIAIHNFTSAVTQY